MAKFTATVDLNMRLPGGFEIVGAAGATHRIPDSLVEEFERDHGSLIPGFTWVQQDEATSVVTLPIAQVNVTGLTADLASKYDKTGGTISGAATVTGTLGVGGAATVSGTLNVIGATTLSAATVLLGTNLSSTLDVVGVATLLNNANLSAALGVTGVATLKGAVNASSTLGVTGKATFLSAIQHGGTAFPTPATNDHFYRTDLSLWFHYDGTRWLSDDLFVLPLMDRSTSGAATIGGLTATTPAALRVGVPYPGGGSDIYIVDHILRFFVVAGTALGASHKWVGLFAKVDTTNTETTIVTDTIDSGSVSVWRSQVDSVNALLGSTSFALNSSWTKTGTPGNLILQAMFTYRIVAT